MRIRIIDIVKKYSQSDNAKEFFSGSLWSFIGSVISKGLIFFSWVLMGRILGSYNYGEFGIIRNTIVMFSSFAGLGLGITASKFVSEYYIRDKEKAGNIIGLTIQFAIVAGIVIGLICFFLSHWLAVSMLKAPHLILDIRIASIMLVFSSLNGAQIGALQGLQSFKKIALINIGQSILSFPFFVILTYFYHVLGGVCAYAFYTIIICVLSHYSIKSELKKKNITINWKKSWCEKKIIWAFSIPSFIGGLMLTPLKWVTDILLVNTQNGFKEMGIFTAAYTYSSVFVMITAMMDAPLLTLMSKNKESSINSKLNRINLIGPWGIGIIVTMPFLAFPELGGILFGKSYDPYKFKLVFSFILFFTLIILFRQGLSRILAVHNKQWFGMSSEFLWGICLIITFYFCKKYGAIGLGIAYTIAYLLSTIYSLYILFNKDLIPRNTVLSKYSIYLWLIIILLLLSSYFVYNYIIRLILLFFIIFLFYNILKKYIMQ